MSDRTDVVRGPLTVLDCVYRTVGSRSVSHSHAEHDQESVGTNRQPTRLSSGHTVLGPLSDLVILELTIPLRFGSRRRSISG